MSKLFSPIRLRNLELANRIVVSPMCQYSSTDGLMNDWHMMHLGQFCFGSGALVFTEATHVSAEGRISPYCAGLWNDAQEAAMRRIFERCRSWGNAKLGIQLAHAGRKASTRPPQSGGAPLEKGEGAWQTLAPSALPFDPAWHVPAELDAAGMDRIKAEFADAARRCRAIGADVIELHAGHGYLLNQFFSPLANHRSDGYGGSVENRIRYPMEVFEAVRAAWGEERPLGVRISAFDWVDGGTTIADTIVFARALEAAGCDFIDITSGGVDSRQKILTGPGYQVGLAAEVKQAIGIPVMAVGMIRKPQLAENIITDGKADFIMQARGAMYDPRWAWRAALELGAEIDFPARYGRCEPATWRRAFED